MRLLQFDFQVEAKASDHNAASAHIIIDDRDYLVIFTRSTAGGTIISIRDGNMVKDYLGMKNPDEPDEKQEVRTKSVTRRNIKKR